LRSQAAIEELQCIAPAPPSRKRVTPTRDTALRVLAIVGIVSGALMPALGLLGALGEPARLPLALLAAIALLARALLATRDPADTHPIATVAPVLGAATAACWAQAT